MSVELARRAVACKHWRWMPGMLVFGDPESVPRAHGSQAPPSDSMLRARIQSSVLGRFFGAYDYNVDYPDAEGEPCDSSDFFGPLPDLTDAATIGCLLALVREARQEPWYYPTAQVYGGEVRWLVERPTQTRQTSYESEASALVAALEAAP